MAREGRLTVAEAVRSLRAVDSDCSCDEDDDSTEISAMQATLENSDLSESDSDDDSDPPDFRNDYGGQSSSNQWDTLSSRAGVTWKRVSGTTNRGRAAAENVFSERSGPTSYSQKGVKSDSPLSAFRLFVDEPMLRSILKFTIKHGQADDASFSVDLRELEKFIGLQIARGVLVGKNTPIHQFWSREWGYPIFAYTMSRDRFKVLMKHLRFDNFSTRRERRQADKFCLISETWNDFIENCKRCYIPSFDLTIDEQLFPCKTRCPFIQCMPNKPDKFGMKFWLLVDASSKYLCNGKPYLGKDPTRNKGNDLPADVCLWLMRPFFKKGYNVTMDNFFTSVNLVEKLKAEKTTLLGTIRKQRKEVPKIEAMMKDKPLHSSEVYLSPSNTTLTIYKAKKAKLVYLLSSMHKTVSVDLAHQKKLPKTVKYYNLSKVGVDVLDQMARYHTCKSATRRWPVAVFYNIIDCACINAYIIYCDITGQRLSRREFLLQLIKEMCCDPPAESAPAPLPESVVARSSQISRKRKQCQLQQCRNKSSHSCHQCHKSCCGKHTSTTITVATCSFCANKSA